MKRLMVLVFAGVVVLAGCGDDDTVSGGGDLGAEDQAIVDDLKAGMLEGGSGLQLTEDEAECAARGMFDAVGSDRAKELSADDDAPLAEDEAEDAAAAVVRCADLRPLFVSSFTEDGDISEDSAECLTDQISDDDMEAFLVDAFTQSEDGEAYTDLTRKITAAMADCLTDEEFQQVAG